MARQLLKRGHRVRALTRNPNKPAARALAEMGAEVTRGDLDDRPSVERALEGVYGVFSVQNFWEAGYDREVSQGITLADAAKAQGVKHFLYSSVGSSYRKTGIAAFDGEWEIEEHIRRIGLPHTILRPTSLMEDWEEMREEIIGGTLAQPLDPDRALQQVSVEDIGVFATMAFEGGARSGTRRARTLPGERSTSMHGTDTSLNRVAFSATAHCLTGCAIGEVLGVVIGTALGWGNFATIALAIVLAFFFGYALTMLPLLRSGLALEAVLPLAFASDTLSITVMEIVDNLIILAIPDAMEAGLASLLFWGSLAFALGVAFVAAFPVNWYLISRGKGHAVMHQYHRGHHEHNENRDL